MLRRFVLAAALVAITFSFALSETRTYKVTKIVKDGDNFVLTCSEEGTFNKEDKKMEWKKVDNMKVKVAATVPVTGGGGGGKGGFGGFGKALEGGFGNEQFATVPDGGFTISITTADADISFKKGDVTKASVVGQKKGKGAN